jgi:pSer/pThr/pTyr-binding forkhead associated (FHA) protein
VSGSLRGLTFRAPQGEYDVGRATLEPRDSFISRKQFRLSCANGALWLADLGGANATRVAGAPASHKTQLAPGVVISVAGNTGVYTRN